MRRKATKEDMAKAIEQRRKLLSSTARPTSPSLAPQTSSPPAPPPVTDNNTHSASPSISKNSAPRVAQIADAQAHVRAVGPALIGSSGLPRSTRDWDVVTDNVEHVVYSDDDKMMKFGYTFVTTLTHPAHIPDRYKEVRLPPNHPPIAAGKLTGRQHDWLGTSPADRGVERVKEKTWEQKVAYVKETSGSQLMGQLKDADADFDKRPRLPYGRVDEYLFREGQDPEKRPLWKPGLPDTRAQAACDKHARQMKAPMSPQQQEVASDEQQQQQQEEEVEEEEEEEEEEEDASFDWKDQARLKKMVDIMNQSGPEKSTRGKDWVQRTEYWEGVSLDQPESQHEPSNDGHDLIRGDMARLLGIMEGKHMRLEKEEAEKWRLWDLAHPETPEEVELNKNEPPPPPPEPRDPPLKLDFGMHLSTALEWIARTAAPGEEYDLPRLGPSNRFLRATFEGPNSTVGVYNRAEMISRDTAVRYPGTSRHKDEDLNVDLGPVFGSKVRVTREDRIAAEKEMVASGKKLPPPNPKSQRAVKRTAQAAALDAESEDVVSSAAAEVAEPPRKKARRGAAAGSDHDLDDGEGVAEASTAARPATRPVERRRTRSEASQSTGVDRIADDVSSGPEEPDTSRKDSAHILSDTDQKAATPKKKKAAPMKKAGVKKAAAKKAAPQKRGDEKSLVMVLARATGQTPPGNKPRSRLVLKHPGTKPRPGEAQDEGRPAREVENGRREEDGMDKGGEDGGLSAAQEGLADVVSKWDKETTIEEGESEMKGTKKEGSMKGKAKKEESDKEGSGEDSTETATTTPSGRPKRSTKMPKRYWKSG
ncbi:uncharacterized protein LTR77_007097 [Saxophila tyrrhenica]|uniref:Uncharacterized protein n=1 Tax=Saxophila tyrrhenica TaxID=1690608 RepID=A0AAV9P462_9PEZI|nr:hypothetical protein LTR77_007097 [Saxophila tyrrhenica]